MPIALVLSVHNFTIRLSYVIQFNSEKLAQSLAKVQTLSLSIIQHETWWTVPRTLLKEFGLVADQKLPIRSPLVSVASPS